MLWLFGQIWIWLLIAFVLGAGVACLVLNKVFKDRLVASSPRRPADTADTATGDTATATDVPDAPGVVAPPRTKLAPPPQEAEQTQQIPVVAEHDDYDYEPAGYERADVEPANLEPADLEPADLELAELDSDPELTGVIPAISAEAESDAEMTSVMAPIREQHQPDLELTGAVSPAEEESVPELTGIMTPVEDDIDPPDLGHREGQLPHGREWHERNEWPDEHDLAVDEGADTYGAHARARQHS